VRRRIDRATLLRLRTMRGEDALALLAIYLKSDATYRPIKNVTSRRWHLRTSRGEFEILTSGIKWYDTRANRGGGGAVDLAMHILGASFADAVAQLITRAREHGPDHPQG
jgi:hypothetical protein